MVDKDTAKSHPRARDAAATRNAILEAAISRFGRESYDRVGLREIAQDAGVDAALIVRYFGSKEDLLRECLAYAIFPQVLSQGKRSEFGENFMAVFDDHAPLERELNSLKLLVRSATVPALEPILKQIVEERLMQPFVKWLGGEDAQLRARIINALAMGALLQPLVAGSTILNEADTVRFRDLFARSIQRLVDAGDFSVIEQAMDAVVYGPPTGNPTPAKKPATRKPAATRRKRSTS
jgi:AcrR family transcriptional regulator